MKSAIYELSHSLYEVEYQYCVLYKRFTSNSSVNKLFNCIILSCMSAPWSRHNFTRLRGANYRLCRELVDIRQIFYRHIPTEHIRFDSLLYPVDRFHHINITEAKSRRNDVSSREVSIINSHNVHLNKGNFVFV